MAPPRRRGPLRAVVTDIDGTLTDRERRLLPEAVNAVRRLERAGVPVILATGNVLPIALALHRFLGLTAPIVAENGGVVYRPGSDPNAVEHLADRSVALRGYRALLRAEIPVRRLFTDRWRETEVALEPSVPVATVQRALRRLPLSVEATGFAIHLIERGVGKLPAVRAVLAPLGITIGDCLVLGDGDNDVAMLRAAGFSVSFPDGSVRARRTADLVTSEAYGRGFLEGVKASGILA